MNKIFAWSLDLDITLLWGQSFAWDKIGGHYYGFTQDKIVKCKKSWSYLLWKTYDENWNETNDEHFIKKYFRLDVNFENILSVIMKDDFVKKWYSFFPWLRLLAQDFEQCTLSFIVSASNSIPNIRRSIRLLNKMLWKKVCVDGLVFYLFPSAKAIEQAWEEKLRESKMWFRAKYFLACARRIDDTKKKIDEIELKSTWKLRENLVRSELTMIPWIWEKIADCVLSFSLCYDNVTPVDTWVKKVIYRLYALDEKLNSEDVRNWFNDYFNMKGAYAGQFLFEYVRKNSNVLEERM